MSICDDDKRQLFNTLIVVVAVVVVVPLLVLPAAHVDAVVGYEQSGLVLQIARQLYMDYCTDGFIMIGFAIYFKFYKNISLP